MQHRKPSLIWVIAMGALVTLSISASAQVTDEFHRTVPLPSNGRVSLGNVNGNVTITGWERNEVQIDAVKKASNQQKLDEAKIEVDAGSDYVRSRTRYPENHTNNNPASVTYELRVPRTARPGSAISYRHVEINRHPQPYRPKPLCSALPQQRR